jgi:hypothetical protein
MKEMPRGRILISQDKQSLSNLQVMSQSSHIAPPKIKYRPSFSTMRPLWMKISLFSLLIGEKSPS